MYKYLKFLNDHPSGSFHKGDVVRIPKASEKAWLDSGHVEKSTEKTYDKFIADKLETREKESKEARKAHFDKHDKIAEQNQKNEDAKSAQELKDIQASQSDDNKNDKETHYTLTEEDLTDETELTKGLKVGDEIEINSEGTWLVGEDEKLIVKGNVETQS